MNFLLPILLGVIGGSLFFFLLWKFIIRKNYTCPNCAKYINLSQRNKYFNFSNPLKLVAHPCPHCSKNLIWNKWPFYALSIFSVLIIIILFFEIFITRIFGIKLPFHAYDIPSYVISSIFLFCLCFMRLKIADKKTNNKV
ncbi:MAG: hypothetical protein ABII23_03780 [bacterium]